LKKFIDKFAIGSALGVIIGALPGAGADIAAWISYGVACQLSKFKEKFGKGYMEGIVAATAANNSSLAEAWIPALVFGIPGDSVAAIVIGELMMKGITPGPRIFIDQAILVYTLFAVFFLANIIMVPLGYVAIKSLVRVFLKTPRKYITPLILAFCIIGSYAIRLSMMDVLVMLILGVIGYIMEKNDFPVAPLILGLILGPLMEIYFMMTARKALGDPLIFVSRPLSMVIIALIIITWMSPLISKILRKIRQ